MKRRGFTFIETVAAIAIVLSLLLISFKGVRYYKSHIGKIKDYSVIYNIKELISFSKKFCYINEQPGEIYFEDCDNFTEVYLISNEKVVKKLQIQGDLKILNSNFLSKDKRLVVLRVNSSGYINPFTIKIKNENNVVKELVIQVGGNLIYIKNG